MEPFTPTRCKTAKIHRNEHTPADPWWSGDAFSIDTFSNRGTGTPDQLLKGDTFFWTELAGQAYIILCISVGCNIILFRLIMS